MKLEEVHRRRVTVMSADVVGYAAMMADDATATLGALLAHFRQVETLVLRHGGRIVDAPGDNLLVEFPDEVRSLLCAMEIQRTFADPTQRADAPPHMHFRIGLHAGEALDRRGRLYGDPVNIAARLQAAAEPDAVLVSEAVAERASSGATLGFHELGPIRLKNVPYPVTAYRPLI